MINQERVVKSFLEYVSIDSESKNEANFGSRILRELQAIGLETEVGPTLKEEGSNFGNIIARMKGTTGGTPVMFSCHLDTVTPGVGIKPVIRDGVIYSDGTTILGADNKAGVAAIIEALRAIQENNLPHADIEVVFTVLEEKGLNGSKCLDTSRIFSKHAYILDESEVGRIVVQGPAHENLEVKVLGKASHAGVAPEEGISSIIVASKAISKMRLLRIDEETTANIGSIHGGGASNIVPSEVIITAEARSLNDTKLTTQIDHMIACFEEAAKESGAKIEVTRKRSYSAFCIDHDDEIVKRAQAAFAKLEIPSVIVRTGGGSDTNIFNSKGLKSVTLGIGEAKAHTLEEHVRIEDLVNVSRVVLALIEGYAALK